MADLRINNFTHFLWIVVACFDKMIQEVTADVCLKAEEVKSSPSSDEDLTSGKNNWRWVNFQCKSGCCGRSDSQYCCTVEEPVEDSGLVTGLAVGGVFIVMTVVVIVILCVLCHRTRQKRMQHLRQRRNRSSSATPSGASLPPSYEMSMHDVWFSEFSAGSHPIDGSLPPSYEEIMSSVTSQSSTHTPADIHAHITGQPHDNAAFQMIDEQNGSTVSVIT